MTYAKEVKCVVWDLDNTVWDGTLLEPEPVSLRPGIRDVIAELDGRGILHSIASRNNHEDAMEKLRKWDLQEYFLYPQINWNSKADSIRLIQKKLNIGMDTIVFVDDQPFERDEVAESLPDVETFDALSYLELPGLARMKPRFVTSDSRQRRMMYLEDMQRTMEEASYTGPREAFMASLNMEFIISEAREEDLERAEELTIRTNQLNATGRTYGYEELSALMKSECHKLYVCELNDRYGSYGKIGLALVEMQPDRWFLNMLLMSCRVMSRSAGSILLSYILQQAKNAGKRLLAHFKQTDRNRMMYITYRFSNFSELTNDGHGNIVLENDLSHIQEFPHYVKVRTPEFIDFQYDQSNKIYQHDSKR